MNPEFQRNLWLELPPHRMVALPAVLLLLFLATWLAGGRTAFSSVSQVVMVLLLVLWGGRLAAETVISEVVGRTWDNQRMSAIGPWEMAWGKLFGGTIYVWYGAFWCVLVFFLSATGQASDVLQLILAGLQTQALAMLLSMLLLRTENENLQFQVTVAQLLTLLVMVPFLLFNSFASPAVVHWYGFAIDSESFITVAQIGFLVWTVLGIYQLMRGELQYNTSPALWFLFVIFAVSFVAGFDSLVAAAKGAKMPAPVVTRLFLALCASLVLTYVAAFVEPKNTVRLRRWVGHISAGRVVHMSQIAPAFMPAALVGLLAAILVIVNAFALAPSAAILNALGLVIALMLFGARDIAMIYYLALYGGARGHVAGVIYLISAYFLVPVLVSAARLDMLLPVLLPVPGAPVELAVLPVLGEAVVAVIILVQRWRAMRIEEGDHPTTGTPITSRPTHSVMVQGSSHSPAAHGAASHGHGGHGGGHGSSH